MKTWESSELISCYCRGCKVFRDRFHRTGSPALSYKPRSTPPVLPTNAVRELVSLFRLERGPPENVLHASRSDKIHESLRKREEDCLGV